MNVVAKMGSARVNPITSEMIHAMTADQRKTLQQNAAKVDSVAAREILSLLASEVASTSAQTSSLGGKARTVKAQRNVGKSTKAGGKRPPVVFGRRA